MKSSAEWSIGDVARRFGLPTHVLRPWESMGCPVPFDECPHAREQIEARIPAP